MAFLASAASEAVRKRKRARNQHQLAMSFAIWKWAECTHRGLTPATALTETPKILPILQGSQELRAGHREQGQSCAFQEYVIIGNSAL